jgi:signal transduction histidine kinase
MMSASVPKIPESLVPMVGDYMVERGLITKANQDEALAMQAKLRSNGINTSIGQILVDLGYISSATRDAAIFDLILHFRTALQEANSRLEQRVKQRTAELEKALEQLFTLTELKANLVANISHELRTPQTHMTGYIDLLVNGDFGPLTAEQLSAMVVIQRASERLGHLLEDLILFSVSERDQIYIHFQPTYLVEICSAAYKRALPKAQEREIELKLEIPEAVIVDADSEKISWVITQFLDNAIKFTAPKGKVVLSATREGNFFHIQVCDTGIGIPENRLEQIFEPFVQLDGSSTRKVGGTGLGLALARRIIETHGSVIHVHSEVGKGSQFEFLLKIHQD